MPDQRRIVIPAGLDGGGGEVHVDLPLGYPALDGIGEAGVAVSGLSRRAQEEPQQKRS